MLRNKYIEMHGQQNIKNLSFYVSVSVNLLIVSMETTQIYVSYAIITRRKKQMALELVFSTYHGADISLARPGGKKAMKHIRDLRDFNNIEARAFIKFFFPCTARRLRKFTPF
jgi:hypothetical protein